MNVKNGIASSVSFCMMPKMRSGSACNSVCGQQAQLDADEAEEQAAGGEANATGKPSSRKTTSPANMIGAKFASDEGHHDALPAERLLARSASVFLRISSASCSASSSSGDLLAACAVGSSIRPCRNATRLISSETPCSAAAQSRAGSEQ